ncbi:hypothetical protein M569_06421 [Genlisea aurea]|uniref:Uncharacterized protein n=1 Tax=Genlisea aurea TaxID=192259 RepID=S8DYL7_9LAMI|nr:hypothetical protein M569_06421 [Genlisea aurea]
MAAAMATSMALLNLNKSFVANATRIANSKASKSASVHRFAVSSKLSEDYGVVSGVGSFVSGAVFSFLAASEPAIAAQQLAVIADADNRGLALLIPIVPAIGWVLFNILQPALNQINRMRSFKGLIAGIGIVSLASSGLFGAGPASAGEIATLAETDNRGQLLLFVIAPAIGWVLFNIFQPALNQINRMRSE